MYIISQISVKAQTSLHILRGSRKFCQRGFDFVFFCCFFLVDEGRDCRTNNGPTFTAGLVTLWFFKEIHTSIARKPYSFVIFQGGGSRPLVPPLNPPMRIRTVWVQTPCPPSETAHAHTHSLARAFTACLLKVVDMQVRKLSTPSPKDVDCIPCELYSLQDFE